MSVQVCRDSFIQIDAIPSTGKANFSFLCAASNMSRKFRPTQNIFVDKLYKKWLFQKVKEK